MTRSVILAILCTGVFFASNAWPHPASSAAATATATVVEGLSVTGKQPLSFGFVTPSAQGGTVTVSPDNIRSETGGIEASSSFMRAEFDVRGMPGRSYTIHAPASVTFSLKEHNHGAQNHLIRDLAVKNFVTYSVTAGAITADGKLNATGQDRIYLGATLIVPPNAAPGIYSGWVPLTVSY